MFWNLIQVPYQRFKLHHVSLLCLLLFYSYVGAVVFCAFEAEHEDLSLNKESSNRIRSSVAAKKILVQNIQHLYFHDKENRSRFIETQLRIAIDRYDSAMDVKPIINHKRQWDIWGGLYYAGTVYTTIGYGDLVATTVGGRIFTIFYALIGIPLVITILNDWGTLLFRAVGSIWKKNVWSSWVTKTLKNLKRTNKAEESLKEEQPFRLDSKLAPEQEKKEDEPIPLYMVLVVLIFWFTICVSIFCYFENWTIFQAAYFFFISLTTIGFGDVTLTHSVAVCNFLFILIGLSVVSMAINVVQMKLEILFSRIVKKIDKDFKNSLGKEEPETRTLASGTEDVEKQNITEPSKTDLKDDMGGIKFDSICRRTKLRRKMLNEKAEDRSKMRNRGTQTTRDIRVASVQTNEGRIVDVVEEEEEEPVASGGLGIRTRRLYIYNCGE